MKKQFNVLIDRKYVEQIKIASAMSRMSIGEWMETALDGVFSWEGGEDDKDETDGTGSAEEVQ